jgi:AAA+ ATPase superfamily predicted ATPase
MQKIIGRTAEIKQLKNALDNNQSELLVVFGRRRVGKTYLIRQYYKEELIFETSGLYGGNMADQLHQFNIELSKRKRRENPVPKTWMDAFAELGNYINSLRTKKKKVIFIDEFPWMATAKSKFIMAFENFWNNYCTRRTDLVVVLCGSAASFMIQKIIRNKGGLHNRISRKIRLLPFSPKETADFLKNKGIDYTAYDILQLYMTLGGIPHYLDKLEKGLSMAQNIDMLCFKKDALLKQEFNELFTSLFDNSERHLKIVRTLALSNQGMSRSEQMKKSMLPSGGDLSLKLSELSESGFITEYQFFGNRKHLTLYRLTDEYSKFYLKFMDKNLNNDDGNWVSLSQSHQFQSWAGFTFESLCLKLIQQIKKALKIEAVYTVSSCWYNDKAQIDLLIDSADNIINVCEIKFSKGTYTIDKKQYMNLKNKIVQLQTDIGSRKNIFLTMISTHGIAQNKYSNEIVQNSLTMHDLFK